MRLAWVVVVLSEYDGSRARMPHLLLIDDDTAFLPEQVRLAFPSPEHTLTAVPTGAVGIAELRSHPPDVVLLDLRLPDQSGLAVFEKIREIDARVPVIFVTSSNTTDTAIEAMKRGAFNYLRKPLDLDQLHDIVYEALDASRMRARVKLQENDDDANDAFIGSSAPMLEVCKAIGRVAAQDVAVLVTGESGTGKELVARAIYQHGPRSQAPFLALNCAAIPEALLESELFGHERGAFTGADRRRIGKFEQCSGGTILLDEIGDMPLLLQAKILRILQDQTFQRVGGTETVQTDVRIIAATHRDLRAHVADGKFRADLYYRLAVCTIELPALRERPDDIPLLVRHFVARYNRELDTTIRDVTDEAMRALRTHSWPGNVRELQSVVKRALLRSHGDLLLAAFLPELEAPRKLEGTSELDALIVRKLGAETRDLYAQVHREVDRLLMVRVLEHTNGNHRHAARILGIARQTMRTKLQALGLRVTHAVTSDENDD
jgi:two-component system nitrogen regulation response regulator GlnG